MLPGVDKSQRRLVSTTRVFQREIECQFRLVPRMKRFIAESNAAAANTVRIPCADVVYGSYDDDGAGILVLIDLNDKGKRKKMKALFSK